MTPFDSFLHWVLTIQVWDVVKAFILVGITLYLVFAVVMIRQVALMRETITAENEWWVTVLAWLHLAIAMGVWVVAFLVL